MNDRQLADKIGNLDESFAAEAFTAPPKRKKVWPRIAAAAAVLALAVGLWPVLRGGEPGPVEDTTPGTASPTDTDAAHTPPSQGPALPLAAGDLMAGLSARVPTDPGTLTAENAALTADFGLRLLRACDTGGNVLISPYSVLSALGMTALGARGETLQEMTAVLGRDPETLGAYLRAYGESLPGEAVSVANAIWLNRDSRFHAQPDFLQKNADTYCAAIHAEAFDDATLRDINAWAGDRTHGMIPEILDELPRDDVMVLLNALAFEARWERGRYHVVERVENRVFTAEDGARRTVSMMFSRPDGFFTGENVSGFLKNYENGFAFAALLPDEGVTVEELLASLTGEQLRALLAGAGEADGIEDFEASWVTCGIPKFTVEGESDLREALTAMGMVRAFEPALADLSGLGYSDAGNVFISRVLHKTLLEVAEDGTRAAAVTAVETKDTVLEPCLTLDRPFLCMVIDTATHTPLFLALIRDIGAA